MSPRFSSVYDFPSVLDVSCAFNYSSVFSGIYQCTLSSFKINNWMPGVNKTVTSKGLKLTFVPHDFMGTIFARTWITENICRNR